LIIAIICDRTDIAKLLIGKGADINVRNLVDGTTALIIAARYGRTDIIRLLIDKERERVEMLRLLVRKRVERKRVERKRVERERVEMLRYFMFFTISSVFIFISYYWKNI